MLFVQMTPVMPVGPQGRVNIKEMIKAVAQKGNNLPPSNPNEFLLVHYKKQAEKLKK